MVGEIVWAPFPFTDLSQAKPRPVLVVADVGNTRDDDWIVCEITSNPRRQDRAIAISRRDMESGRLRPGSQVRPDRLTTLNEAVFQDTVGRLSPGKLAEVLAAVRNLF